MLKSCQNVPRIICMQISAAVTGKYIMVYEHISSSSVNAGHFKLPHNMVREDNKHISKSRVDLS